MPLRLLAVSTFLAFSSLAVAQAATPGSLDSNGNPAGFRTLALGDAAPDFALKGIDGRVHTLAEYAGTDVLMVLFTSNHCPTSHGIEKRLMKLRNELRDRSFTLIAINPNHPDGLSVNELGFGEFGDSFEEMKPYAESNGWDFPYLYDGDTQEIARAYGCLATPHVFLFDRERRLRYAGRYDDSRYPQEETVKSPDARNAIMQMLAGKPVSVALTKPHGCSTKWREKRERHVAAEKAWTQLPVEIARIDDAGVAALRANPTNKYRLVNLWATWCAPCVEEFPMLVAVARRFDLRDFELITISLDNTSAEAKARAFLQKQGAGMTGRTRKSVEAEGRATNHYLYTGKGPDALSAVLDTEWPGPIPHSVLIAPGGEIVWRHSGMIDQQRTISELLAIMTPYYQP